MTISSDVLALIRSAHDAANRARSDLEEAASLTQKTGDELEGTCSDWAAQIEQVEGELFEILEQHLEAQS